VLAAAMPCQMMFDAFAAPALACASAILLSVTLICTRMAPTKGLAAKASSESGVAEEWQPVEERRYMQAPLLNRVAAVEAQPS